MLFLLTSPVRGDSLNWETVKLIINSQHNLAVIGISVLVGVALLIVIINIGIIKDKVMRDMKKTMKKTIKELKDDFKAMEDRVEKEVDGKLEDVDKKMQLTDEKMKLDNKLMGEEMALFDAEKSRLFALTAHQAGVFNKEAYWWARAIIGYANPKVDYKDMIKLSVDSVIESLEKCIEEKQKLKDEDRKEIEEALSHIPDTLDREKKKIEDLLKKLL